MANKSSKTITRKRPLAEEGESTGTTPAEKPVSLHPLKFEEAVKGLLKTGRGSSHTRRSQPKPREDGNGQ